MLYDIVYICICYKTYSIQQFVKTPFVNAADEMTNCPPMAITLIKVQREFCKEILAVKAQKIIRNLT